MNLIELEVTCRRGFDEFIKREIKKDVEITNANGSEIYLNFADEFGITGKTVTFNVCLATINNDPALKGLVKAIKDTYGATGTYDNHEKS